MKTYTPDKSVLLKIKYPDEPEDQAVYKIFATWMGGYTYGDSWKLNSGITKVEKDENGNFIVHGYSGSVYHISAGSDGTSAYTNGILTLMIREGETNSIQTEILPLSHLETLIPVL